MFTAFYLFCQHKRFHFMSSSCHLLTWKVFQNDRTEPHVMLHTKIFSRQSTDSWGLTTNGTRGSGSMFMSLLPARPLGLTNLAPYLVTDLPPIFFTNDLWSNFCGVLVPTKRNQTKLQILWHSFQLFVSISWAREWLCASVRFHWRREQSFANDMQPTWI